MESQTSALSQPSSVQPRNQGGSRVLRKRNAHRPAATPPPSIFLESSAKPPATSHQSPAISHIHESPVSVAINKVSNWTPDEVWEWLQSKLFFEGFDHEDWDDVTGQSLLSMGKSELKDICPRRFPIESLLEAIDQLKQKSFTRPRLEEEEKKSWNMMDEHSTQHIKRDSSFETVFEGVDEEEFEVEIVNTYQENPNYSANLEKNVFKVSAPPKDDKSLMRSVSKHISKAAKSAFGKQGLGNWKNKAILTLDCQMSTKVSRLPGYKTALAKALAKARSLSAQYKGDIFSNAGDALEITFEAPHNAMNTALEFQEWLADNRQWSWDLYEKLENNEIYEKELEEKLEKKEDPATKHNKAQVEKNNQFRLWGLRFRVVLHWASFITTSATDERVELPASHCKEYQKIKLLEDCAGATTLMSREFYRELGTTDVHKLHDPEKEMGGVTFFGGIKKKTKKASDSKQDRYLRVYEVTCRSLHLASSFLHYKTFESSCTKQGYVPDFNFPSYFKAPFTDGLVCSGTKFAIVYLEVPNMRKCERALVSNTFEYFHGYKCSTFGTNGSIFIFKQLDNCMMWVTAVRSACPTSVIGVMEGVTKGTSMVNRHATTGHAQYTCEEMNLCSRIHKLASESTVVMGFHPEELGEDPTEWQAKLLKSYIPQAFFGSLHHRKPTPGEKTDPKLKRKLLEIKKKDHVELFATAFEQYDTIGRLPCENKAACNILCREFRYQLYFASGNDTASPSPAKPELPPLEFEFLGSQVIKPALSSIPKSIKCTKTGLLGRWAQKKKKKKP